MNKLVIVLLCLFLLACTQTTTPDTVIINGQEIFVTIADTTKERQQGLMNVEYLESNHGMLFIFEDSKPRTFWMKNTLIPLDAYFFNEDYELVDKLQMEPCTADPCQMYKSTVNSQYVLEVNKGVYDFKEGDLTFS